MRAHVVWKVAVAVSPYQEGVESATKTLVTGFLSSFIDRDLAEIFIEINFRTICLGIR